MKITQTIQLTSFIKDTCCFCSKKRTCYYLDLDLKKLGLTGNVCKECARFLIDAEMYLRNAGLEPQHE